MYPGRNIEKTATAREKVVLATINKVRFNCRELENAVLPLLFQLNQTIELLLCE